MKTQAFNPYLPSYEYIPDAEPHVFGERVYIYGSHDRFNGISFCLNDYVCWSAPVNDLSDWRFEGTIWKKSQDPRNYHGFLNSMFAPDVCQGPDGRFYLFYFIGFNNGFVSVAVCDTPVGEYQYYGDLQYPDGVKLGFKNEPLLFDPGVFADDDGRFYIYLGFGPDRATPLMGKYKPTKSGAMCFELEQDMLTVKGDFCYIGVPAHTEAVGTPYEGHAFFEASSMRKFRGKYYFIYSSYLGHELCYAISDSPTGPFSFGGTLVSNGDIGLDDHTKPQNAGDFTGNTHGSLICINDQYYVFYHRQTNRNQFSRQACAEKIRMTDDGHFLQAERTSCGLNGSPLEGRGTYEARIACKLVSPNGNRFYSALKGLRREPYFTQSGNDRENNPDQYIASVIDQTVIGFKYFRLEKLHSVSVLTKGKAEGMIEILTSPSDKPIGTIQIHPSNQWHSYEGVVTLDDGIYPLYFKYCGKGSFDFKTFTLE